jgi:predicted peroxiredoxin
MADGGTVWACPPCSSLRGYTEEQFLDGVEITGAGPVYDLIREGAATICL